MLYFTADLHLVDDRFSIMRRPLFSDIRQQIDYILDGINQTINADDDLVIVGDLFGPQKADMTLLNYMNGRKHLILGNYDIESEEVYNKYFDAVYDSVAMNVMTDEGNKIINVVHKPEDGVSHLFNIVGHIHGLWQVQRNMLNVGCDAWHFRPVPIDTVLFMIDGIKNHFDINVFAAELDCNESTE